MALALSILLQSLGRFINVEVVNSPLDVLIVACVGLALNIASATVIHGKDRTYVYFQPGLTVLRQITAAMAMATATRAGLNHWLTFLNSIKLTMS